MTSGLKTLAVAAALAAFVPLAQAGAVALSEESVLSSELSRAWRSGG